MGFSPRHIAALLVSVMVLGSPAVAFGAPANGPGTIELAIAAPEEGTALVEISRVGGTALLRTVVHRPGDGPAVVELPVGTYRITPRAMSAADERYVARSAPLQVRVESGQVARGSVQYVRSKGVQRLQAKKVTTTSISLDWDAELGEGTFVRRTLGDRPAQRASEGTAVAVDASALTDTGLEPGTTYTYSVFARPGDGAFGLMDADPVSITVGTTPEQAAPDEPTFVLNPRTRILSASDVANAVPTGDGVRLDLAAGLATPVPGTILSLPVSPSLRGGYLGEVVAVAQDGGSVWLEAAALGAAFDLYVLDVPDFGEGDAAPAAKTLSQELVNPDEETRTKLARKRLHGKKQIAPGGGQAAPGDLQKSSQAQSLAAPSAVTADCSASGDIEVSPHLGMSHAGHADVTIDKHKIWFVEVPSGVSFDVGYSTTLTGSVDIEATNAVKCGLPLPNYFRQITLYPVPIAIEARPEIGVSMASAGSVKDLGFAATAGFAADGQMGFTGGNHFDGDIINTSTPTQPTGQGTFGFGFEVGGSVAFGPGVGTADAGVLVGVGGEIFVVDASANVVQVDDGDSTSTCIELAAASRMGIFVTLRAWLPGYEFDYTTPIEPLQTSIDWLGSPWHWPDDCTESETPTDDVVGDGVTPIDDDLVGSSDQWGKVDGFVPGESTWVLSTGRVQEAVGAPSFFASTDLGTPGDANLSALSGFATYDAAAFSVTVIPNGETLKVRYAFASEEYPEYVGSSFNDAMAVFVDGTNCALVPGTSTPVAINTVNAWSHPELYIDNQAGASGYGTTMDGLTTPLTCSVPVTPGKPVTIKIAVADASDSAYDSAVALLDGGIWSE